MRNTERNPQSPESLTEGVRRGDIFPYSEQPRDGRTSDDLGRNTEDHGGASDLFNHFTAQVMRDNRPFTR